jgi:hypothetical protein
MVDMKNKSDRYPNLTPQELEIIGYFAEGQKHAISSPTLKLECTETSIRLIDSQGKLIGISKQTNDWQRKVLISKNFAASASIIKFLTDRGFVTKQKSSHPDFTEHHQYQLPIGYKLNHTEVLQLWKVWWNNKRYQLTAKNLPIDVLIFSKGNWYQIQDLQPKQGNFILKTDRGELTILAEDFIVWIDKADPQTMVSAQSSPLVTNQIESRLTPPVQTLTNLPVEATIPAEVLLHSTPLIQVSPPIDSIVQTIELPESEEDLDLESYLSTFNTEDTEDIDRIEGIYNIRELLSGTAAEEELPPLPPRAKPTFRLEVTVVEPQVEQPVTVQPQITPSVVSPTTPKLPAVPSLGTNPPASTPSNNRLSPPSISERKQSLKLKAVNTLNNYLHNGDVITHTEVIRNGRGQVMNRKQTTVRQSSPGWTVEQIKQLQDELAEL